MKTKLFNKSILFTVGVHGDEHAPVSVTKSKLPKKSFLICNHQALVKNVRFIESDLNRSFPGNHKGGVEEKLAYKLVQKLKKHQFIIDIHTATCVTPPFIVATKITPAHVELIRRTGVKKVVLMSREFGAGKSLIDFVPVGISIESGREKSLKTKIIIDKIVNQIINNELNKKQLKFYKVFKTFIKTNHQEFLVPNIHSFKLVTAGTQITNLGQKAEENFYPILARSRNYPNFLCLMAKKVNLSDINVKISL